MNALSGGSCNCMYGPQDPRCCIPRAQRARLEEAWEMGRRGEPLPPVPTPPTLELNHISGVASTTGTRPEPDPARSEQ